MPNLNTYLDWHATGNAEDWLTQFTRDPLFMIGHRGTSITLYRGGVAQTAQDFLVVPLGQATTTQRASSETAQGSRDELLVLGASDADIRKGDEFSHNALGTARNYRVAWVERTLHGSIQARAELLQ